MDKIKLVVTHANCLDGFTAGRLYATHSASAGEEYSVYAWDVNTPFSGRLDTASSVVFLDCCPTLAMLETWPVDVPLHIIDHHASTASRLADLRKGPAADRLPENMFQLCFSNSQCASELVCEVLSIPAPWFVKHVADKDLWTWKDPLSKPITRALGSSYDFAGLMALPEEEARNRLIASGQSHLRSDAAAILSLASTAERLLVRPSPDEDWSPARVVRLPEDFSHWEILSELGETVATGTGMSILLQTNGKVSCRSVRGQTGSLDCNKFCQQFGGGGHANAAGGNLPALLQGNETEFTKAARQRILCSGSAPPRKSAE